jgi:predicted MFS family arabinose efflux permease
MRNRWAALAIIFTSFIQFTLNWFAIIPMLSQLTREMSLTPLETAGISSAFVAGYGIAHIPGGMLAERYGMRFALLAGVALEGFGAFATSEARSFELLLLARFLCGVGGSIYVGSAIGLTAAWFRQHELATANGLITGVAFSLGAAIGIFWWGHLADLVGWRAAIQAGSAVSAASLLLLFAAYPRPPIDDIRTPAAPHRAASLRRSLVTKRLWSMSFAYFGGYGSYFAAVAMMPSYAVNTLHLSRDEGNRIGAILMLSGMIGSFLGGWLADRVLGLFWTFLFACALEGVMLIMIPLVSPAYLTWVAGGMGLAVTLAFVSWIGLPGSMQATFRTSDVPTAAGLMLTIVAVGGVLLSPLYAALATTVGPDRGWVALGALTIAFATIAFVNSDAPQKLN